MGKLDGYEKARRIAELISESQRRRMQKGEEPSLPETGIAGRQERHITSLRKRYNKERKYEIASHPERKMENMGDRHRQPLMCVETGELLPSLTALARKAGLTKATVCINIDRHTKIMGKTFIRITKEDEKRIRKERQDSK